MRRATLAALVLTLAAGAAHGQTRGGVLRVSLVNGTTGGPGAAEKVTLLRLGTEMTPVRELDAVSGSVEITGFEVEGERPMLLQVTASGVNYNQPVNFFRGYEADAEVTVYDAFREWDDDVLEVTTSRHLYRRDNDKLLVDKVYVVENRTSPPRTYFDPEGTFRFHLPTAELLELHSVSASSALGVPVPQQASPLPDGSGYVTKTAFKPGETQIAISYEVRYDDATYQVSAQTFQRLPELLVFVAPPDVDIGVDDGWEDLGVEPQGRFAAIRMRDVPAGTPFSFSLSGGSTEAGPLVPSSSPGNGSQTSSSAARGTITRLEDDTLASKWVLIVLMAAALGYGLLANLYPRG